MRNKFPPFDKIVAHLDTKAFPITAFNQRPDHLCGKIHEKSVIMPVLFGGDRCSLAQPIAKHCCSYRDFHCLAHLALLRGQPGRLPCRSLAALQFVERVFVTALVDKAVHRQAALAKQLALGIA